MTFIVKECRCCERGDAFPHNKDKLAISFDHIGGEGDSDRVWGSGGGLFDDDMRRLTKGSAVVTGTGDARYCAIHFESKWRVTIFNW